jgi:uncharacterized damage-inducible protein DinB
MHAFYEQFLDRLGLVHEGIGKTIDGLTLEAIDWIPGPEMNSLGILMAHVAGSEKHWFGDVIAGEQTARDREAEFRTRGRDAEGLRAGLQEMLAYGRSVVGKLELADLTSERIPYPDGRTMPVGSCLLHILRHAAEHAGHMQVTRQLWDNRVSAQP